VCLHTFCYLLLNWFYSSHFWMFCFFVCSSPIKNLKFILLTFLIPFWKNTLFQLYLYLDTGSVGEVNFVHFLCLHLIWIIRFSYFCWWPSTFFLFLWMSMIYCCKTLLKLTVFIDAFLHLFSHFSLHHATQIFQYLLSVCWIEFSYSAE
jgi:hypothetical protein